MCVYIYIYIRISHSNRTRQRRCIVFVDLLGCWMRLQRNKVWVELRSTETRKFWGGLHWILAGMTIPKSEFVQVLNTWKIIQNPPTSMPEVVHPNYQVTSKITFNIISKITCENHVQNDLQDHPALFINTWCGSKWPNCGHFKIGLRFTKVKSWVCLKMGYSNVGAPFQPMNHS